MAKLTKADRTAIAKKGAKTKAYRASLQNALNISHMIGQGMSPAHVALLTDQTIKDVLDALKLLTFVPYPPAQEIGVGAHGIGIAQDIINTMNLTKKGGAIAPKVMQQTKENALLTSLRPFAKHILSHPEQVRGDIVNTLNSVGHLITDPIASAEDFFRKLTTGQP